MNKYKTGCYHVALFDKHGTRQDTQVANSLMQAERLGRHMIQHPPHASYVVMRVLQNSKDNWYPWRGE